MCLLIIIFFPVVAASSLLAHAPVLESVSPLEMLASVMGPPIAMPSTMGGALEFYLVAGLPWVPLPSLLDAVPSTVHIRSPVHTRRPLQSHREGVMLTVLWPPP